MIKKKGLEIEDVKRKKTIRQKFRSLIRSVMFNRLWLMETEDPKISLSAKKNISMLIRKGLKIGMLTLGEKSLIRTHHSLRSIDDRKKLISIVKGLTCFAKISPKVRARLVPVIKFMVVSPGRVIIREGNPATTAYFILQGEVEITHRVLDYLKNTFTEKVELISGPGDCIGDFEIIEKIPRLHTYTATTDVELLVVFEDDFNRILCPTMAQQWKDKRIAIKTLGYFDFFNKDQIFAACKLGILQQFEPLETIYYQDKGHMSYVHFVISGECIILQSLSIKVMEYNGNRTIHLFTAMKAESSFGQNFEQQNLINLLKEDEKKGKDEKFDVDRELASLDEVLNSSLAPKLRAHKLDTKAIEIACGLRKQSFNATNKGLNRKIRNKISSGLFKASISNSSKNGTDFTDPGINETPLSDFEDKSYENLEGFVDEIFIKDSKQYTYSPNKQKLATQEPSNVKKTTIENHFIDIGSLTPGGIFGLGENMEQRVIMARSTVQCLMLPRFWLLEKAQNPGNIWQRRRFYLDSTIPSRYSLYKEFLITRKWQKFKMDLIVKNIGKASNANPSKPQDVPIICRIVEGNDG